MRYEMIFGDERLFDGAGEFTGIDIVTRNVDDGLYRTSRLSDSTPSTLRKNPVVAMRRIIAETKHWTWEDKKAGLMPEVGAYVFFGKKGKNVTRIAEFIGTGIIDSVWCLKLRCGSYVFVESEIVNPIETPAEKAQREEDEFVSGIVFEYDKMPSSVLFEAGIRAAYRKLKGGE